MGVQDGQGEAMVAREGRQAGRAGSCDTYGARLPAPHPALPTSVHTPCHRNASRPTMTLVFTPWSLPVCGLSPPLGRMSLGSGISPLHWDLLRWARTCTVTWARHTHRPQGGFSEVWLSEHKETGDTVAIKVVQLAHADLEPEEVRTGPGRVAWGAGGGAERSGVGRSSVFGCVPVRAACASGAGGWSCCLAPWSSAGARFGAPSASHHK